MPYLFLDRGDGDMIQQRVDNMSVAKSMGSNGYICDFRVLFDQLLYSPYREVKNPSWLNPG